MTQKVDPSVNNLDLELKGEPLGSVPLARTIEKPRAYREPRVIVRPRDNNPG